GAFLVEHPAVAFVVFTGSREVGLSIVARAAVTRPGQRHVKRVIAEMGGKNAIVVDTDADLDQAVPAIVASAFDYAGQKCSAAARVIAVGPIHEELINRLVGAAAILPVGHPRELGTAVGPLIDADACERVGRYRALAPGQGEVVLARDDVPACGRARLPPAARGAPRGDGEHAPPGLRAARQMTPREVGSRSPRLATRGPS